MRLAREDSVAGGADLTREIAPLLNILGLRYGDRRDANNGNRDEQRSHGLLPNPQAGGLIFWHYRKRRTVVSSLL